eukprot:CAMPEP_0168223478 /NCGR_PEP_ID=MMETSP0140_2-20121125/11368_1 /TAXON_ID=44445 /ORGANISM="Pseudo-nitzschia australis, Strain 10249 10 AB" /LENGTH=375 /DNA_ID=CAMNT_0008153435 /DNA_START=11 /DNA_END=1135 /DNA_ORIENTATION=-
MTSTTFLSKGGFRGRVLLLREIVERPIVVFSSTPYVGSSANKPKPLVSVLCTFQRTISNEHRLYYSRCHRRIWGGGSSTPGASSPSSSSSSLPLPFGHRGFGNSDRDERNRSENQSLLFSPIVETPFDSTVIEKPYTIILMEDETYSLSLTKGNKRNNNNREEYSVYNPEKNTKKSNSRTTTSWVNVFRSKVPPDHGMSFASISLNWQHDRGGKPSVFGGLQALKSCRLPSISDAILVARGPVASLCAQYYLESFSLQGLVMIDPILMDDGDNDDEAISSFLSRLYQHTDDDDDDDDDKERFRSSRLLVEPNAVPVMVVLTIPDNKAWNDSSRFVAARHGDPHGPYGIVPIVDLTEMDETEENSAITVLDRINEW